MKEGEKTTTDQMSFLNFQILGQIGQICLIDDLLKYAEEENSDGILFAADVEKAFDSVDYNFIFAILKLCNALVMEIQRDISILRGIKDRAILYLHIRLSISRDLIYSSKSRFLYQGFQNKTIRMLMIRLFCERRSVSQKNSKIIKEV